MGRGRLRGWVLVGGEDGYWWVVMMGRGRVRGWVLVGGEYGYWWVVRMGPSGW